MSPALIERLRDGTRDRHESLERDLDWKRRMSTVEGYRGLLARWWGFHAVFEPLIAARPPLSGLASRPRLHLLDQDLRRLGIMTAEAVRSLPRIATSSIPVTRAGLIGAMYVLEGSTLGGLVIARYVRATLAGTGAEEACAYYEGDGRERTGLLWRAFLDRLSKEVPAAAHADVVAGACRTFAVLGAWLPRDDLAVVPPFKSPSPSVATSAL